MLEYDIILCTVILSTMLCDFVMIVLLFYFQGLVLVAFLEYVQTLFVFFLS